MPPYIWTPPICLDTPIYLMHPLYVWVPPMCLDVPICLEDVWMPPVHTQHKESILCHTKGCPYAPYIWMPHMFGWPHVCLNAPYVVDTPCMFGCPLCLDATCLFGHHFICLDTAICFDAPICLDAPPECLDAHICLDVWTPPVCLDNVCMPPIHTQHKESMLCHTKGVSYAPIHLNAPCMFGCPSCLDTPICLDAPICLNTLLYVWVMFGCPHTYTTHRKHAMSH